MDSITIKRLENYREQEIMRDSEISVLEEIWGNTINLSWVDILTFAWKRGRQGMASRRVKELFIEYATEKYVESLKI